MSRSVEQRERDRQMTLALVDAAFEEETAYPGLASYSVTTKSPTDLQIWRTRERTRIVNQATQNGEQVYDDQLPDYIRRTVWEHFATDLAWLAEHGLIAQRRHRYNNRRYYMSKRYADEVDAELNRPAEERAERTMEEINEEYDRRVHEYGDRVSLWPVTYVSNSDGIAAAIEAGLLVESTGSALHKGYVPADRWDAYSEAREQFDAAQQRAKQIHADLIAELVHAGWPGSTSSVSTEQARWVLAHIHADAMTGGVS